MFAKVSLLLFLYQMGLVINVFRYTSSAAGTVITLWTVVSFPLGFFSCRLLIAQFKLELRLGTTTICEPQNYDVENPYGFYSTLSDFPFLIMSMPMLYRPGMARSNKIGIAVTFATGGL